MPDDLNRILQRHRAFWERGQVDEPLVKVERFEPLEEREPIRLADGSPVEEGMLLSPDMLDGHSLTERVEEPAREEARGFVTGCAPYDLCWTEAMAGCPIGWQNGHVWAEPYVEDLGAARDLRVSVDDGWLARYCQMIDVLAERAQGRYAIRQPLLRGPVDIAAAILGDEQVCYAAADYPDQFRQLLADCTEVFIAAARAWIDHSPPFEGGYSADYGLWAPGTFIRTQCDNSILLSPQMYREFLVPCDERICSEFDYPLIHTHSNCIWVVADALVEVESLRAIQVSLDYPSAGPSVAEQLPLLQKINQHKSLVVIGGMTQEELDLLLDTLSPVGLTVQARLHNGGRN